MCWTDIRSPEFLQSARVSCRNRQPSPMVFSEYNCLVSSGPTCPSGALLPPGGTMATLNRHVWKRLHCHRLPPLSQHIAVGGRGTGGPQCSPCDRCLACAAYKC